MNFLNQKISRLSYRTKNDEFFREIILIILDYISSFRNDFWLKMPIFCTDRKRCSISSLTAIREFYIFRASMKNELIQLIHEHLRQNWPSRQKTSG